MKTLSRKLYSNSIFLKRINQTILIEENSKWIIIFVY